MSIVPMLKVTVVGPRADKLEVLADLQALGCLHLVPLEEPPPESRPEAADGRRAREAFRYLKEAPARRHQVHKQDGFDVDRLVDEVLHVKRRQLLMHDRRAAILTRIERLRPFGDVTFPPLHELAGQRLWFYVLPLKQRQALLRVDLPFEVVARDNTRLFVVVISPEEPPPDLLPVARSHVGGSSVRGLEDELDEILIELEALDGERIALTRFLYLLGANLATAEDRADLRRAALATLDDPELFVVQGWLPERHAELVSSLAQSRELALVIEPPRPGEAPPTLLDEAEPLEGSADLTLFYATPAYRSFDPSLVVFGSFALFFAMIVSDAGYALLLGLLLAWAWPRLERSETSRRLRPIGLALIALSFVWGVLSGSYFGLAPPNGHPLAAVALIDLDDFDAMMRLSIVIGVGHIALANALLAWHARPDRQALAPLGWILVVAGGLIGWLAEGGLAAGFGWILVVVGLGLVLIGEGLARPVVRPVDWALRLVDGAVGLARVTKIFGDVLSYLRLFALGFASASLAVTFNQLAADLQAALPGLGLALSLVVLVFGHTINLALAVMSGVVHGLRLNFIEFFSWGLKGEGYLFRAFRRREVVL